MNRHLALTAFTLTLLASASTMATNGDAATQSASLTELMALHTQGVNHQLGRGVRQDATLAARWYLESARLGYADSQNDLAKLYDDGRGVPRDEALAFFWYTLAMEHGNACAALDRERLVVHMSPGRLQEARTLVRSWRAGTPARGWVSLQ